MSVNVTGRHAAKRVAANCYVISRDGKDIAQVSFLRAPEHIATVIRSMCEVLDEEGTG